MTTLIEFQYPLLCLDVSMMLLMLPPFDDLQIIIAGRGHLLVVDLKRGPRSASAKNRQ